MPTPIHVICAFAYRTLSDQSPCKRLGKSLQLLLVTEAGRAQRNRCKYFVKQTSPQRSGCWAHGKALARVLSMGWRGPRDSTWFWIPACPVPALEPSCVPLMATNRGESIWHIYIYSLCWQKLEKATPKTHEDAGAAKYTFTHPSFQVNLQQCCT